MNVTLVNERVAYSAPNFGDDALRIRVKAELLEVSDQLRLPHALNNLFVQCIAEWHTQFLKVLNDPDPRRYPNPREVTRRFVDELERILKTPERPSMPPVDIFGDISVPIIRFMVEKMKDRNSLFYCEHFAQEAIRVLAERGGVDQNDNQGIANELLAQLRQLEANNAREVQQERQNMEGVQALRGRLHQRGAAAQANLDRLARESMEAGQRMRDEAERLRRLDLEQRDQLMQNARMQRREAEQLRDLIAYNRRQLDADDVQLGEIDRCNMRLQNDINQFRADVADKRANWLEQVACIAGSVALSLIFKKPIIITPNMVRIGSE